MPCVHLYFIIYVMVQNCQDKKLTVILVCLPEIRGLPFFFENDTIGVFPLKKSDTCISIQLESLVQISICTKCTKCTYPIPGFPFIAL